MIQYCKHSVLELNKTLVHFVHSFHIRVGSMILLVVFMLLAANSNYAQQQWHFLGGPQGIYPNDILFTKSGKLLCSTYEGIFISTDDGDSWIEHPATTDFGAFHNMTERLNGNILAVTDNGIAVSKDLGTSWSMVYKVYRLNDYAVTIIESPKDSSLFYARDSLVFKSTDDGKDWTNIWTGSGFIDSYAFSDSGDLYIGERFGKLLVSKDGGLSFAKYAINYPLQNMMITKILTIPAGGLYFKIYGYPDWIIHYENNKATEVYDGWTNLILGETNDGNLIYKHDNTLALYNHKTRQSTILPQPGFVKDQFAQKAITHGNIWITSFSSHGLHRSTDGGSSWSSINNGLGYKECLSIYFDIRGNIYTGTFGFAFWGGLYKSQDNGKNWTSINLDNSDSYVTHIYTGSNGSIIAGASYGVYFSNDVGNSWTQGTGVGLVYGLYVSKNGVVYDGDIYNGLCISRDNGHSFTQVNNGLDKSLFFGFGESRTGRIFAASWPNGLYYSDNQGANWTDVSNGIFAYNEAYNFQYKNDTIFAATSGGVAYSIDNGVSWNMFWGSPGSINKILISSEGDLVAAVKNKGIYISRNNGITWNVLGDSLLNLNVYDIAFDKYNVLYAATSSGIYTLNTFYLPEPISPENGQYNQPHFVTLQWNKTPQVSHYYLQVSTDSMFINRVVDDSSITDDSHIIGPLKYMTTYYWRVGVKTSEAGNAEYSLVNNFTTSVPQTFSMEQNYPNPFNPTTTVVFAVPKTSVVSLKVYNALGQFVTTLFNKQFNMGSHQYIWNASSYPSGVYFLRFEADGFSEVKKALLIK